MCLGLIEILIQWGYNIVGLLYWEGGIAYFYDFRVALRRSKGCYENIDSSELSIVWLFRDKAEELNNFELSEKLS